MNSAKLRDQKIIAALLDQGKEAQNRGRATIGKPTIRTNLFVL